MDGDGEERVLVMNRPKSDVRDNPQSGSPGDLIEELRTRAPEPRPGRDGGAEPAPAGPEPEGDTRGGPESFEPGSGDYKAYGWAGNKTLPSLLIIFKDGSEGGINYCDLASAYPGGSMFLPSAPGCRGNVIRLRVAGDAGVFMIAIEGVRLRRVWELIMGHKTPWIHELPAGQEFGRGDEPVIWTITIQQSNAAAAGR
jgi:hypothetical protein